jgi:hypothetical protein
VLTFNYNSMMTQFRLLAPGLIRWVTRGLRLGYERHFLGNQVDDVFLENSLWSTSLNCTPGETDPADAACPVGTGGNPNAPSTRMTAADVAAVTTWQKKNIKLDLAFNAFGASSSDPLTTALLSNKNSFRWTNHTWSHPYLGCQTYNAIAAPAAPVVATGGNGGDLPAGDYRYAVTALTPYGETTASPQASIKLVDPGAVEVTWQPVSGAHGYRVYGRQGWQPRAARHVERNALYRRQGHQLRWRCAHSEHRRVAGPRMCDVDANQRPRQRDQQEPDIRPYQQAAELRQDRAGTGEHSGLDNPNMPAALRQTGISTLAADASRQFDQYPLGPCAHSTSLPQQHLLQRQHVGAVDRRVQHHLSQAGHGWAVQRHANHDVLAAAGHQGVDLASESKIMLGHVLSNDPRLGYSHQSNLTGDRLILELLGSVLTEYRRLYLTNTPIITPTLESSAAELARQDAWRKRGEGRAGDGQRSGRRRDRLDDNRCHGAGHRAD